jgi:F-type H+-transporting ATPase subunit b
VISINFFNILATVINVLVLFLLVQKFLVKPIMGVIEKRENMINSQFEEAKETKETADSLKTQYEDSLKSAHEESLAIVDKARTNAQTEYDRIVKDADDQAKSIVAKAKTDAELEKDQALKEVKSEIGDLIALAVGKVATNNASAENDKELIDKFLADVDKEGK